MQEYTVNQLSKLAGVSRRTLHYYDEINLLKPSRTGENRYRYYDQNALIRLQQVMFYRELGLPLEDIREIVTGDGFDVLDALEQHKAALTREQSRLTKLIGTINNTIDHLKGDTIMSDKKLFTGFTDEEQAAHEKEVEKRYGTERLNESRANWGSYSEERKAQILKEGGEITLRIRDNMDKGIESAEVQQGVADWHKHIGYFYECDLNTLMGLGQMYVDDPAFRKFYEDVHPDMPEFFRDAIEFYCVNNA